MEKTSSRKISILIAIFLIVITFSQVAYGATYVYTKGTNVNFRKGASTNSALITTIKNSGTKVEKLGVSGSWTKVKYNGKTGYIYSSYISKTASSSGSTSSGNEPKGYSKTATYGSKTYRVYNQGNYKNYKYWDGTISSSGCGICSVAIAASGYGIYKSPVALGKIMTAGSLDNVASTLKKIGISNAGVNKVNKNNIDKSVKAIKENLDNNKPVIVLVGKSTHNDCSNATKYTKGGHFMVLVKRSGNTVTILNPNGGKTQTDNITTFVKYYMAYSVRSGRGFVCITK